MIIKSGILKILYSNVSIRIITPDPFAGNDQNQVRIFKQFINLDL